MSFLKKGFNRFFLSIERFMSRNWFNPFATLYINFRSMPFRLAMKMPIYIYGRPYIMGLSGIISIKGNITRGMIKMNYTNLAPSHMKTQSELCNLGTIIFNGRADIRSGNRIVVASGAILEFGENIRMSSMNNICCLKHITIGNNVRIAHRCQFFDSNHHYLVNLNTKIVPNITQPINIGAYSWICNTTTINAGAIIPSATIVASNSVVNKDFSTVAEGSIIGGIPAKVIASGYRLVNNIKQEAEIAKHYAQSNEVYHFPEEVNFNEWFNIQ